MTCEGKVFEKTTTKIKVSTEKKVLYFKESFTFQSKRCTVLKKVLYLTESSFI